MNQTQLEEQTVEAFRAWRRDKNVQLEAAFKDEKWFGVQWWPSWEHDANFRIKPQPTPKVIKVEGVWDGERFTTLSNYPGGAKGAQATATIEVKDTQKEPKVRREWKAWVHDVYQTTIKMHTGDCSANEIFKRDGYRLTTLVEKGGGE